METIPLHHHFCSAALNEAVPPAPAEATATLEPLDEPQLPQLVEMVESKYNQKDQRVAADLGDISSQSPNVMKKLIALTPEEQNFGRGESLMQTCKTKCRIGRRVPVQAECMHVAYDISFFTLFAVGWIMTGIWNPAFVANNPVLIYFGNNNVCVGFDSFPARFVTLVSCVDAHALFAT